jgi:hypothetical protein
MQSIAVRMWAEARSLVASRGALDEYGRAVGPKLADLSARSWNKTNPIALGPDVFRKAFYG